MAVNVDLPLTVPDVGSSLGRVAVPAADQPTELDDIREGLLTRVLRMTDEARRGASRGDADGTLIALGRSAWLEAWEWAVRASADRIAQDADAALADAAWRVRLPRRRRRRLPLSPAERRTLAARLGSEGRTLVEALDRLELAANRLRQAPAGDAHALESWQDAVLGTARRLETAWLALLAGARGEREAWRGEADALLGWRPSLWPVAAVGLPVTAALVWAGLILGGYLDPPTWLAAWLR